MANTFDLQSKLNRAIYALIIRTGIGDSANTFAGEVSSQPRTLPNTTIEAGEGNEESSMGNFRFHGVITFRDDAILQPNQANPQAPFIAAQTRSSAIIEQLVLSDGSPEMEVTRQNLNTYGRALAVDPSNGATLALAQDAAANADMVDFTALYWRITDYGTTRRAGGEKEGVFFEREVAFESLCCNSNVD